MAQAIGTGSYEGWTKDHFLHEIKGLREVVSSPRTTIEERSDAITAAMALQLVCGDEEFSETVILPMIHEMQLRQEMMNRMFLR
ncbi:hypothetical protein [Aeromonas hydrophila]|uniref:hypothetical protein n=1 Tax=Aeromonas hydrophila TaxID=644 RepID=UPI002B47D77B|nr:hypothetical protein [Aeromonas hydrophila]